MKYNMNMRFLARAMCLFGLSLMVLVLVGCNMGAPGETASQVRQRHVDVSKTNLIQVQSDLDAVLLLNKPSRLSDKAIR